MHAPQAASQESDTQSELQEQHGDEREDEDEDALQTAEGVDVEDHASRLCINEIQLHGDDHLSSVPGRREATAQNRSAGRPCGYCR